MIVTGVMVAIQQIAGVEGPAVKRPVIVVKYKESSVALEREAAFPIAAARRFAVALLTACESLEATGGTHGSIIHG